MPLSIWGLFAVAAADFLAAWCRLALSHIVQRTQALADYLAEGSATKTHKGQLASTAFFELRRPSVLSYLLVFVISLFGLLFTGIGV